MSITAEEAALLRSIRRGRKIRFIALGVVAALPFVYGGYRIVKSFRARAAAEAEIEAQFALTDEEHDELTKISREAPVRLAKEAAAWRRLVVPAALAKVQTGEEPCPYNVSGGVIRIAANEPVLADPDLREAAQSSQQLDAALADDHVDKDSLARARRLVPQTALVLVVDTAVHSQTAGSAYVPGGIAGTAYLIDLDGERVACAAPVVAQNSAEVRIEYEYDPNRAADQLVKRDEAAEAALATDLDGNLLQRIRRELRAVP